MALLIEYKLNNQDPRTAVTLPIDIIGWERYTKAKFSDLYVRDSEGGLEMRIGIEDLAVMAWTFEKRSGLTDKPFNVWAEQLEAVIDFNEGDAPNPTQAAASVEPE